MRLFAHVCTCGYDRMTQGSDGGRVGKQAEVTDWKISEGIKKGSVKM